MHLNWKIENIRVRKPNDSECYLNIWFKPYNIDKTTLKVEWCFIELPDMVKEDLNKQKVINWQIHSIISDTCLSFPIPNMLYTFISENESQLKLLIHEKGSSGTEDILCTTTLIRGQFTGIIQFQKAM